MTSSSTSSPRRLATLLGSVVVLGQQTCAFLPQYRSALVPPSARMSRQSASHLYLKNPLADAGKQKVSSEQASSGIFEDLFTSKDEVSSKQQEIEDLDLSEYMVTQQEQGPDIPKLALGAAATAAAAAVTLGMGADASHILDSVQHFFSDPTSSLESVVATVESMGPAGALYFGVIYVVAEVLAIPAFPLTASAGYLFGTMQGTAVVLTSASIAAAVSFVIGRTILRSYVEDLLEDYPEFKKMDKAIGKEGFKLMLLLRLSPIFPFALSNYLYGASSVGFWEYFWGTMIGFTPGTIAYVYSGEVGKALTLGGGDAQPWYIYAGGFAVLTALLKVIADTATSIIEEIEAQEE